MLPRAPQKNWKERRDADLRNQARVWPCALRGIDETDASLIVCLNPMAPLAGDLMKLLAYSDDVPVVFGTRTSREFIWAGANMGRFLRWGNWAWRK